ncbi:MAG: ribosome biogenesis GTPase YlqF [Bacilli bacterium]|nr:ribosome biogenesis GTPase YlqF [Bacilli bacterium]
MNENKTNINWYPGHMAKTKRELKEIGSLIDIAYEVIDSRMPISSRVEEMDEIIKDKPRIIISTKYDLCDKKYTDEILDSYRKDNVVIPIDLLDDKIDKIIEETNKLMVEVNNKRKEKGLEPRKARVMVIGIPNVGKSSLINRLCNKKVVGVGNKPGVTKSINWIRINEDIELLDSPGILWPKFVDQERALILASLMAIKEEILDREKICSFILDKMFELYPEKLEERYGITKDLDIVEIYDIIGKKRGCLVKGGEIDYDRVVDIIIRDFNNNSFGNITFDRLGE